MFNDPLLEHPFLDLHHHVHSHTRQLVCFVLLYTSLYSTDLLIVWTATSAYRLVRHATSSNPGSAPIGHGRRHQSLLAPLDASARRDAYYSHVLSG